MASCALQNNWNNDSVISWNDLVISPTYLRLLGDQMFNGIKVSVELGIYASQIMRKDVGQKFYESECFEIVG